MVKFFELQRKRRREEKGEEKIVDS